MLIVDVRKVMRMFIVCSALMVPTLFASAQQPTPSPSPRTNPAQRDATRPPGSEQNQSVPPEARPNTQNPTVPPNAEQPPSQAPPGSNVTTQTPAQQNPATSQEPQEPNIPQAQPRPIPPLPDLTRLGIAPGNVLTLSLNEAIRLTLKNNNDIEVSRDDVRYAETQLRSLQGVYDPLFLMTPTYDHRITPQSSTLGGGGAAGTVSTTTLTASPAISKQFERTGGTYQLSFSNTRTTSSSTFTSLSPAYASNLSLTFTQPLWRNRRIDSNRHLIRVQKKRIEQSDADFRRKTIDVIAEVQAAYWNLVFALRDQQVQLDNVNLSRENLRQIEAQIAAGVKAPLDRAEVLTELANREQTLLTATQTVTTAENNLKQLMFKEPTVPEWSAQITPTDNPVVDTNPVNLNDSLTEARKNRPELQRLRLQREINDIDIEFFKNQTKPQMDLQTTIATTGLAGNPTSTIAPGTTAPLISGNTNTNASAFLLSQVNILRAALGLPNATVPQVAVTSSTPTNLIGGYGKDLSNLFTFNTRNITVGVAIQIPLHNTTAKANLAGARIQREQLEASVRSTEQAVEVDVRDAAQAVESARLRVLAAREARQNAEVQLEGEQRLYSVGRSTTFLLIQRQNTLANARDQEVRAETDYTKAVSNLQHATSTTLHANNIIVDSPVK
jgi:outer membrane protein